MCFIFVLLMLLLFQTKTKTVNKKFSHSCVHNMILWNGREIFCKEKARPQRTFKTTVPMTNKLTIFFSYSFFFVTVFTIFCVVIFVFLYSELAAISIPRTNSHCTLATIGSGNALCTDRSVCAHVAFK